MSLVKTGSQSIRVTPTSTKLQARVLLYEATQRPRDRSGDWLQTSHGRCRVTGRLGQRHADLMESIFYHAECRRNQADGGVEVLVDPYKIRRTMSGTDRGEYSLEQTQKLLTELRAAIIEIITPEMEGTGEKIIGGLLDHVIPSATATRRDPLTRRERPMWKFRLGIASVMLLGKDLALYHNPIPIVRLQHGVSQAVARHVLTHSTVPKGGWYVDTLIRAVAGELPSKPMRDARHRLRLDAPGLRKIGIVIDGNRLYRQEGVAQPPDTVAQPPDIVAQPPDIFDL